MYYIGKEILYMKSLFEYINEAKQYDISYLEKLDKEYMGAEAKDYIKSKTGKCTLAEFIDAGKIWANDKMSNNEAYIFLRNVLEKMEV